MSHDGEMTSRGRTRPLGKPAEYNEYIVERRIQILRQMDGFLNPDKTLLDFGCGNGATMMLLAGSFRSCHGVDLSPGNERLFAREAAARGITNCSFSVEDLERLEVRGRSYDRIVCFEVLEHLRDDRAAARTMHRLLSQGGKAAVSVPNKWWIFETHGAHLPLLPWNRIPFFSWLPTPLHERFAKARIYTRKRIVHLLREAGFRTASAHHVTAPMDRVGWQPLQRLLRRTVFGSHTTRLPLLATSIMVLAEKE
jgi:2-polyprenyl-3-methyl-5-hydroxy-6-metoxy-1,4-benzoquinol methylase